MASSTPASVEPAIEVETVLPDATLSDVIGHGEVVDHIPVRLSTDIIHLLSEQLYTSPLKAIEELVANSYDADADECRIALFLQEHHIDALSASGTGDDAGATIGVDGLIAVLDDGVGMTKAALHDLWSVGASPKRGLLTPTAKHGRMSIGKFGIGKLATYAVANRITYLTASEEGVHHVICDFTKFGADTNSTGQPIDLDVTKVEDLPVLLARPDFTAVLERLGITADKLATGAGQTWTLCLLDNLKPKAKELQVGRLGWVLQTAMPLQLSFKVFLNGDEQKSSKEKQNLAVQFTPGQLDESRIASLNKKHSMKLVANGASLIEPTHFPNGIHGDVVVAWDTLRGKSERYARSFGFFVRVRGRLINTDDPLFHNPPHSFTTFNRFRADLEIDDLHEDLTAPREGVGLGERRDLAVAITHEIGLQARDMFEKAQKVVDDQKLAPEHKRIFVAESLVERPLADALTIHGQEGAGGDVDDSWIFLEAVAPDTMPAVVAQLYEKRTRYQFNRSALGETEPLTKFSPATSAFSINTDHELVKAFDDDARSRELLELIAAAEVMLEVYLVETDVTPFAIGEVLTRRDLLLRSLATDRVYSRATIAAMLRNSKDSAIQLELALIAAARALGFQVKHVAGSKQPDGVARYLDSTMTETKLTLEAKSSQGVPALSALDFAGLHEHKENEKASGCLTIAPSYPAELDDGSSTANRAKSLEISCWTIEQLARVVERGEDLEITAAQVAQIVTTKFAPLDVTAAIEDLLSTSTDKTALYRGIMRVISNMFATRSLTGSVKRISSVAVILAMSPEFAGLEEWQVKQAVQTLAAHTKGAIVVRKDLILFHSDLEEIVRLVAPLTGDLGDPRSLGSFRQ